MEPDQTPPEKKTSGPLTLRFKTFGAEAKIYLQVSLAFFFGGKKTCAKFPKSTSGRA